MKKSILIIISFCMFLTINLHAQYQFSSSQNQVILNNNTVSSVNNLFIVVSERGDLFVNINNSHRILQYTPNGEQFGVIETNGKVTQMASNCNGDLFVNINNSHYVFHYNYDGQLLNSWEARGNVTALSADNENTVFVNINNSHHIVKYTFEGEEIGALEIE